MAVDAAMHLPVAPDPVWVTVSAAWNVPDVRDPGTLEGIAICWLTFAARTTANIVSDCGISQTTRSLVPVPSGIRNMGYPSVIVAVGCLGTGGA